MAKSKKSKNRNSHDDVGTTYEGQSNDHNMIESIGAAQYEYPVAVPDVSNMDDVATLLDEDLYSRLSLLEADRSRVLESRMDPRLWEVEIAYLRREVQIRRSRRDVHDTYCREQARALLDEERNLPAGDFDNSKYMVFN